MVILQDPDEMKVDFYDTMQVCIKNGHKITEAYDTAPEMRQDFCHRCGSKTTTSCKYCEAKIRGYHHIVGVVGGGRVHIPTNCHKCGKPYEWKNRHRIKAIGKAVVKPGKYIFDTIAGVLKRK